MEEGDIFHLPVLTEIHQTWAESNSIKEKQDEQNTVKRENRNWGGMGTSKHQIIYL